MSKTRFGSLDGIHQIKKKNVAGSTMLSAAMFILIFVLFLFAVSAASIRRRRGPATALAGSFNSPCQQSLIYFCQNSGNAALASQANAVVTKLDAALAKIKGVERVKRVDIN